MVDYGQNQSKGWVLQQQHKNASLRDNSIFVMHRLQRRREGRGKEPIQIQRVSVTTSTTTSAFPFSFKILDVLDQVTRKALVKSTKTEIYTIWKIKKNTSGYIWYYSDVGYIWGQLQLRCQSLAQSVTNRGKKRSVLFWFFVLLSSLLQLMHIWFATVN